MVASRAKLGAAWISSPAMASAKVKVRLGSSTEFRRSSTESSAREISARQRYESSIDALTSAKREYLECFERWMLEITECGVILRDIRSGLLDFPAKKGAVDYYLCWRLGERDIDYWHLENDGFQGRRPLAVLDEYF